MISWPSNGILINTRPEIGEFTIALLPANGQPKTERRTTDLATVLDEFAGYILLNHDGTMNQIYR